MVIMLSFNLAKEGVSRVHFAKIGNKNIELHVLCTTVKSLLNKETMYSIYREHHNILN